MAAMAHTHHIAGYFRRAKKIWWRASSCMRFGDDADAAVRPIARLRPEGDVHLVAECGQQTHQAPTGEVREPSAEEGRHFRLVDAHERRHRNLSQTLTRHHLPDMARKRRLGQLPLGFRRPGRRADGRA